MMADTFKADLKVLGLDVDGVLDLESITIRDVVKAFRRKALLLHPDKTRRDTKAEFQELNNSYESALRFLVEREKTKDEEDSDKSNDANDDASDVDEKFVKEYFSRFNFPQKNTDSFTVFVENCLADAWQECFEKLYGKPVINKNKTSGTESGRVWKILYGEDDGKVELTIHFYNKPVKTKKSKFLIQGGSNASKCLFVFNEMPGIYKLVCDMIPITRGGKT